MRVINTEACDDLAEHTGKIAAHELALREEQSERLKKEIESENPDLSEIQGLTREITEVSQLREQARSAFKLGCGIGAVPEDYDPEELDEEDWEEIAADLAEIEDEISGSMPEARVEQDISYDEDVAADTQRKTVVSGLGNVREEIDDKTEAEVDTEPRRPTGPMSIVCKYPDPEDQQECIERQSNRLDTEAAGVTRAGGTF
jgi:hypothetical protein